MSGFNSHIIDDSEKEMAWKIGEHGFDMRRSRAQQLAESLIRLNQCERTRTSRDEFLRHDPGTRPDLERVYIVA